VGGRATEGESSGAAGPGGQTGEKDSFVVARTPQCSRDDTTENGSQIAYYLWWGTLGGGRRRGKKREEKGRMRLREW